MHFNNLTALRISLAILVTFSHSYPLTSNVEPIGSLTANSINGGSIAVWAFFFLSGYLIPMSYDKNPNLVTFTINRFVRIWPGLIASLLITLLIAWTTTTEVPFSNFWASAKAYFFHNSKLILGIAYNVTGAFPNAPHSSVNGSLWTLPWELRMYILVAILGCTGILLKRELANAAVILISLALILPVQSSPIAKYFDNQTVPWMLSAFLIGIAAYTNRTAISVKKCSAILIALSVALFLIGLDKTAWLFLICGITYFVGFTDTVKLPHIKTDTSYGIYIYSFPIQQLLISSFEITNPAKLFLYTLPIVFALALASWQLVEKPSLIIKNKALLRLKNLNC